jgi:hypothetical protein
MSFLSAGIEVVPEIIISSPLTGKPAGLQFEAVSQEPLLWVFVAPNKLAVRITIAIRIVIF